MKKKNAYTIYDPTTKVVVKQVSTMQKADNFCTNTEFIFDDTCPHGTAYDICEKKVCN